MYLREKCRRPENAYPRNANATSGLRSYSPAIGRFVSRDPVGEDGGLNLHAFVQNSPLSLVDLGGMTPVSVAPSPLYRCLAASRYGFDVKVDWGPAAGKPWTFMEWVVRLNKDACACVCEYPDFIQHARKVRYRRRWRLFGPYVRVPGPWQLDAGPRSPYYTQFEPRRFEHEMDDLPGYANNMWAWRRGGVDARTMVLCTRGSAKGRIAWSKQWGIEVWQRGNTIRKRSYIGSSGWSAWTSVARVP